MQITRIRRIWVWLGTVLVVFGAVIAWNWQTLMFALAVGAAERRPALLSDAQWNEPATARKFLARFGNEAGEEELLECLGSNNFTINRAAGHAERLVRGLPCNETIEVAWTKLPDDKIAGAQARVSEAGCL